MHYWQNVINNHKDVVWQTIYRIVNNYHDACDCFQQTFIDALIFSRKQKINDYKALLVRIATNKAIDKIREKYRSKTTFVDTERYEFVGSTNGPVQSAENSELAERLLVALLKLNKDEAEVFCLRHLNEMSYSQIARIMSTNTNNIGVIINRAKTKLQNILTTDQFQID